MSTAPQQTTALAKVETSPLILELAGDWKISPVTMINTLKATIFPQKDRNDKPVVVSNEQMIAFLQVCNVYKLNPFVREIYAFPTKGGGIVPMVPIDGWANIINRNLNFDGLEFLDVWDGEGAKKSLISTTCVIYRKDRSHPIKVTEYLQECYNGSKEPWKQWPARMLRHKALIQCARIAFSLAGIFDPDEAERIADSGEPDKPAITRPTRASEAVIEGQTTVAQAAVAEPTTGEASNGGSTAKHQPAPPSSGCFCSCCKANACSCKTKSEFDQCGCPACKLAVAAPPVEVKKEEPRPTSAAVDSSTAQANNAGHGSQPSGEELFPQPGQQSKPAGPYITQKQVTKLIIAAKASGIDIRKDQHDDLIHKTLLEKHGIQSFTEIPVAMFEDILKWASNAGPVKVNAK